MSQENLGVKTFIAGADLEAYRRVKLSSGNVVYAGAGESFIGVTTHKAANGTPVSVAFRSADRSYKLVAAGAVTAGAVIYGAANGKVDDAASGTAQGTALEAATADGDVIECLLDNGAAGSINGDAVALQADGEPGSVPIVFHKQGIADATTSVTIATPAAKVRVIDWWLISRDTTAANIKLVNVSTDMTAVKAKGTTNDAVVRGGDVIAAQRDIAAGTALKVNASAIAAFDIFVVAIKVS